MINRAIITVVLMFGFALASLGLAVSATDRPPSIAAVGAAGDTLDASLRDRVEALLRTDTGLAGARFRILASGGVVTVGGAVPDEASLRRAIELASTVRGVREVRNLMEIENPK